MSHRSKYVLSEAEILGDLDNVKQALRELRIGFKEKPGGREIHADIEGRSVTLRVENSMLVASGYELYKSLLDEVVQRANVIYITAKLRDAGFCIEYEGRDREKQVEIVASRAAAGGM